ncbi:MAG: hypothetical protein AAFX01_09785 [Cyanobacteria bacterium J06638_28]
MPELPPFHNPPPEATDVAPVGDTLPSQMDLRGERSERWQGARTVMAWLLRWMLLGVGVGGAWCFGVLLAQFFPASAPSPPFQEIVVRRTHRFGQKVRRLPEWWAGNTYSPTGATSIPRVQSEPTPTTAVTRPIVLPEEQREQVTVELEAIQSDLQQIRDRTSAVETQLGITASERPLEERLAGVANRLTPPTAAPSTPSEANPETPIVATSAPDPLFQVDAYRVTLPSDVLFAPPSAILEVNAQPLLDSILLDVGRYPGATILVSSYSDASPEESTPTDLSYKQARSVQQYLSQRLGDQNYHWVVVGYGNSTLGAVGTTQLSRRVSIAIVP